MKAARLTERPPGKRALGRVLAGALVVLGASCSGSTGSDLVTFPAYAAGPEDADPTAPLTFQNGHGYTITLDLAVLHLGGVYLNRALPVSGSQETSCILPAQYVAQVSSGLDLDTLSPTPVPFPVLGEGTETHAVAGEVWLTSGDVNAADDPTPIARVHGHAERGGVTREFQGTLTIGKNRAVAVKDPSQPGANPICKQRIVSPIPVNLTPENHGSLLLRVDPRAWFASVEIFELEADADGVLTFLDENQEQPNLALFQGLRASAGVYAFSWRP